MARYWWNLYKHLKTKEWEREHSSLIKLIPDATFESCKRYACEDITSRTCIDVYGKRGVIEEPKGKKYNLIGRVNTRNLGESPELYYKDFVERSYISFSTFSNKNISRYKNSPIFLYNFEPDDIVHIFPMDADSECYTKDFNTFCGWPSIWLDLDNLEVVKNELKCYDQVTCKTQRDGKIIKPVAIGSFGEITVRDEKMAKAFGIPNMLLHPDDDVIDYRGDVLYDKQKLKEMSKVMNERFGIEVECMEYS